MDAGAGGNWPCYMGTKGIILALCQILANGIIVKVLPGVGVQALELMCFMYFSSHMPCHAIFLIVSPLRCVL